MSRLKLFLPLIVFLVLASLFLLVQVKIKKGSYDPKALPSARLDKPFPAFSLPTLSGDHVDQNVFNGGIYLVNVWGTWCISCRVEHPFLIKMNEEYGVKIVGLNYKDESQKALTWLSDFGDPYELNIFDEQGKLGLDLGVFGAPETFVVDKNGIIRYRHVGVIDERVWASILKPLIDSLEVES